MKKIIGLVLLALCPGLLFAEEAKKPSGPEKGTISTYRIWAKDGHEDALKAALTAHAAKFHTGSWKWRVYEILTGPEGGGYMIAEGPNSWTDLEGRGDLGAEHTKDYVTNITPHVDKTTPEMYATYEESASTVAGAAFSTNKILIRHLYVKPGRGVQTQAALRAWKMIYAKSGLNIAVWRSFFSGEGQFMIVDRLKKGLADLDDDNVNLRKTGDEVLGSGGYDSLLEQTGMNCSKIVDEILEFRPELSSK